MKVNFKVDNVVRREIQTKKWNLSQPHLRFSLNLTNCMSSYVILDNFFRHELTVSSDVTQDTIDIHTVVTILLVFEIMLLNQ